MLFNSLSYALFLPLVVVFFFLLAPKHRTLFLLLASCVFYMAFIPVYILILAATILVDYIAGIYLEKAKEQHRRGILIISISSTVLILAVFKYYYFILANIQALAPLLGLPAPDSTLHIILPIGLSFHTFQSLSYVIEVYHRRQKAEYNFITYATYVMFFPQLVAGPIERPGNLLSQFGVEHRFEYERTVAGLKRIGWGLFKKLVIADRLALYCNDVFHAPAAYSGANVIIAAIFFTYQIYCDFSGYADIALGSASMLGFRLMENFRTPLASKSIGEFWQRWHISLSTWFRDYVYIPLGGNRTSRPRWLFNILFTFGLSGLWHGASWTYVIWGLLNGIYLIVGQFTLPLRNQLLTYLGAPPGSALRSALQIVITFLLTVFAFLVFRAQSLHDVGVMLGKLRYPFESFSLGTDHYLTRYFPITVLSLVILELWQREKIRENMRTWVQKLNPSFRLALYSTTVITVALFGVYQDQPFIYFQF